MLDQQKKRRARYWETLTDDQLLKAQLITDDPESLDGLVTEIPDNNEEPYVEYKYDLRHSGRAEFTCVHGNHKHLAGFVMRKGSDRYLVGWMCGKSIYGEDFDEYQSDFNAAINRQDSLKRLAELRETTTAFARWLHGLSEPNVFGLYERVRSQIRERMPWVWNHAALTPDYVTTPAEIRFPRAIFDEASDPGANCGRVVSELATFRSKLKTGSSSQEQTGTTWRGPWKASFARPKGWSMLCEKSTICFSPQS
jgi:hypothetical protein